MSTVLVRPDELADTIVGSARELSGLATQCRAIGHQLNSLLSGGATPASVKTQIDLLLVPVGASLDAIRAQLDNLTFKAIEQFQIGAPAGLQWFRLGGDNANLFYTVDGSAWGKHLISFYDPSPLLGLTAPNANLFSGLAIGDVVRIENSGVNDGSYLVLWTPAAKADNSTYGLTQGDFSGGGSDWTAATDWDASLGDARYSSASGTTARTLTQALSGMTAGAAYAIQFELTISGSSPAGTLRCSIGGTVYWEKTISATAAKETIVFVTDSPSTTPTLTFTATRASGTFALTIDNVYVYGAQGLVVSPAFSEDTGENSNIKITLEQTVA